MVDESGKPLADYKFRIKLRPSKYIANVSKLLEIADIDKNGKDKVAFGVALGMSMAAQVSSKWFINGCLIVSRDF